MSCGGAYLPTAHALLGKHSYLLFRAIISLVFFHMVRAGATGTKFMTSTHKHSLYEQKSPLSRLDFFFGGSCENIAEKPKFYASTVVYFTLADHLETNKVQESKFRDCHRCISIHFASVYFDD